nr:hypothetical protein [Saliphagus infecundisoli]
MREAARLVDRDVSDVHADLKQLEVLGILELKEGGPGGAIQPVIPFDKMEMHIDYPPSRRQRCRQHSRQRRLAAPIRFERSLASQLGEPPRGHTPRHSPFGLSIVPSVSLAGSVPFTDGL